MVKTNNNDETDALAALHAHFANSFDTGPIKPIKAKKIKVEKEKKSKAKNVPVKDEIDRDLEQVFSKGKSKENDGIGSIDNHLNTKSVSKISQNRRPPPETIVFGESSSSASIGNSQGGWRKFMSSKVETRKDKEDQDAILAAKAKQKKKTKQSEKDDDKNEKDEKEMTTNDKALSELLSTTLFAPERESIKRSNGRPNLSSNSTLSRLMELSQPTLTSKPKSVGRGLGGNLLKANEMGKMPSSIRHGLRKSELEKQKKELEKSKELGIYHQSIKNLIGKGSEGSDLVLGTREKDRKARTREKGLTMGVGKFTDGTLHLSQKDVAKINQPSSSSFFNKKGGSGKRKRS